MDNYVFRVLWKRTEVWLSLDCLCVKSHHITFVLCIPFPNLLFSSVFMVFEILLKLVLDICCRLWVWRQVVILSEIRLHKSCKSSEMLLHLPHWSRICVRRHRYHYEVCGTNFWNTDHNDINNYKCSNNSDDYKNLHTAAQFSDSHWRHWYVIKWWIIWSFMFGDAPFVGFLKAHRPFFLQNFFQKICITLSPIHPFFVEHWHLFRYFQLKT